VVSWEGDVVVGRGAAGVAGGGRSRVRVEERGDGDRGSRRVVGVDVGGWRHGERLEREENIEGRGQRRE